MHCSWASWVGEALREEVKRCILLWEGDRQSASEAIAFLGVGGGEPPLWRGELRAVPSAPGTLHFYVVHKQALLLN